MGFSFGNAIAAVEDPHTRACLMRLGKEIHASSSTLSTVVRNAVPVTSYALSSLNITAGNGLTGGGDLSADRTINVASAFGLTITADDTSVNQAMVPIWTGVHTFSAQDVHNAGVDLGASGRLDSQVTDGSGVSSFLYQPTTPVTADQLRYVHSWLDSTATYGLRMYGDFSFVFLGNAGSNLTGGYINVSGGIGQAAGISFIPSISASSGSTFGKANTIVGAQFIAQPVANLSPAGYIVGGFFGARAGSITSGNNPTGFVGAFFQGSTASIANSGKTFAELGGWRVVAAVSTTKNAGTFTTVYGGYIENQTEAVSGTTYTDLRGLIIEEMTGGATTNVGIELRSATAGYKAITIRDANAYLSSPAAASIQLNGTNVTLSGTNVGFYAAAAVAQATVAGAASAFVTNTSLIANDTGTWDGYTIGQVVKALRNLGLLA